MIKNKELDYCNVSRYISSNYSLYNFISNIVHYHRKRKMQHNNISKEVLKQLNSLGYNKTPDGAVYTFQNLRPVVLEM